MRALEAPDDCFLAVAYRRRRVNRANQVQSENPGISDGALGFQACLHGSGPTDDLMSSTYKQPFPVAESLVNPTPKGPKYTFLQ